MRWFPRDNAALGRDPRFAEPAPPRLAPSAGPLTRFLGGSPLGVALRLILVSIVVGALMMWLDIHPEDILVNARKFVERFWNSGFETVRQAARYLLFGAVVVVPVFLIARLLSWRRPR